ncbi:glycosyltransferase family 4 protein [Microbacterium ureisolvens]|uniref:glycosyltransferase family 4 protein n=1 Tax=Microbacterium ureisolvens TaxID=2781186 RepID=UPI00362BA8CA
MTGGPSVRFVVPAGVDDPRRVSGGNVYDRKIRDGLRDGGWAVTTIEAADAGAAASALRDAPDGGLVLVDGLVAGWAPDVAEEAATRVRLVVLAHMLVAAFPDATDAAVEAERRACAAALGVITTSRWTADELARRGLAEPDRIAVARPGAEPRDVAQPRSDGDLLCVGVIAPHKGQDTLLAALGQLDRRDWTCAMVGSEETYPEYAAAIARAARGFGGRVRLRGALGEDALADEYRRSALLVAPSRVEASGMAIADARAWGLPVVAAEAGGIPDTLAGGGGLLVAPGDAPALAGALRSWMTDAALRDRLRREALAVRPTLPTWARTVAAVSEVLEAA